MIIDETVKELLNERQEFFNQASHFETILLENDGGLVEAEDNGSIDDQWYREPVDQVQAPESQPAAQAQAQGSQPVNQAQAPEFPEFDSDDLAAIQITQTQEIFTKMYLIRRLDKLKRYVKNLIDVMEMKFDIDEFDRLKKISIYINTLDGIALILPAETLYHIIVDFEFELLELVGKIDKATAEMIQEIHDEEEVTI